MKNRNLILACLSGTAIEWFDFSLFGVLSPIIANLFFPNNHTSISLLNTFAVYATGFLMRPAGALFWGYWGDKVGRKKVVIATITTMTLSTVMMGLLPTYAKIGLWAPIFLIALRLMQGFSASGEQPSMLTYLYETAPMAKKKLLSSISYVGVFLGMGLSMLLCLIMHLTVNEDAFNHWGWRIPFLSSILLGYIGYSLRIKMIESESFQNHITSIKRISKTKWFKTILQSSKKILSCIGIFQLAIVAPYIAFVYMIVYSIKENIFSSEYIYFVTLISLLTTSVCVALFSYMAEKTSLNLRLISIIGLLLGSLFMFKWFFSNNIILYATTQLYFGLFTALLIGPFCSDMAKIFTVGIRCSAVAICINLSASVFGGLTPLIMSSFQLTKSPITYSIAFIVASCLVALCSEPTIRKIINTTETS